MCMRERERDGAIETRGERLGENEGTRERTSPTIGAARKIARKGVVGEKENNEEESDDDNNNAMRFVPQTP